MGKLVMVKIPERPNFEAIDAAAESSTDSRTRVLALIGSLVFSWSNNESMFIYVLMILLETDEVTAAVVFASLNTTRARLDLVQRLAAVKLEDEQASAKLGHLIKRFNELTKIRNEFNHCMYGIDEQGRIAQTHALKIQESKGRISLGKAKPMDEQRIQSLIESVNQLKTLNRELWDFLPALREGIGRRNLEKP